MQHTLNTLRLKLFAKAGPEVASPEGSDEPATAGPAAQKGPFDRADVDGSKGSGAHIAQHSVSADNPGLAGANWRSTLNNGSRIRRWS